VIFTRLGQEKAVRRAGRCEPMPFGMRRVVAAYQSGHEEETRLMAILEGRRARIQPIVILALHTGMRRVRYCLSAGIRLTLCVV
jgi:hypothetical protein